MRDSSTSIMPPNRRHPQAQGVAPSESPKDRAPSSPSGPVDTAMSSEMPEFIADPAFRRPPRAPAQSWFLRLKLVTGVLVVVAASVLVAWGMRRYLYKSPRFAVRTVVVEGASRLSSHVIAEAGGVLPGTNVFAIDEGQVEARLKQLPWVLTVKVSKELPDVVRVLVTEHEPRLLVALDGELYLVDHKGEIFKALGDGDPSDFPVVTGIAKDEVVRDRPAVAERLRRVLDLVVDLEGEGVLERYPLQEIHTDVEGR
ncbi:MAG: FtsQ-type POTRA domain-containing protein, partial [Myxococcales bacterium]|nr:FtsQ-type POTRA domain-containing protein [Myxococcales bacterium]